MGVSFKSSASSPVQKSSSFEWKGNTCSSISSQAQAGLKKEARRTECFVCKVMRKQSNSGNRKGLRLAQAKKNCRFGNVH